MYTDFLKFDFFYQLIAIAVSFGILFFDLSLFLVVTLILSFIYYFIRVGSGKMNVEYREEKSGIFDEKKISENEPNISKNNGNKIAKIVLDGYFCHAKLENFISKLHKRTKKSNLILVKFLVLRCHIFLLIKML